MALPAGRGEVAPSTPATERDSRIPLAIVLAAATTAVWGLSIEAPNYATTCLVFAIVVATVEIDRRCRRPELAWWVTNSLLLPWSGLVLLPWTLRLASDVPWEIGAGGPVARDLPHTWTLNLLALVGFAAGTLLAGRGVVPSAAPALPVGARLSAQRLVTAFVLLMACYLSSLVMTGRPLAAIWLLSGDYVYSGVKQTRVGLGFLDLAPVSCVALVLATASFRRQYRPRPPVAELVFLLAVMLLVLGSGVRSWVYMLALGWLVIQFRLGYMRLEAQRRIALAALLVVVALAGFLGIGYIGIARSGQSTSDHHLVQSSIASIDVIGSEERLGAMGVQLGSLNGLSYTELPSLFLPRRLTGVEKKTSAAQQVVNSYLNARSGFSAPLWFEAALNGGRAGLVAMTSVLAVLLVRAQVRMAATRSHTLRLLQLGGPGFMLVVYLFLSRLILFQTLITMGSMLVGGWLAARCIIPRARAGHGPVPIHPHRCIGSTARLAGTERSVGTEQRSLKRDPGPRDNPVFGRPGGLAPAGDRTLRIPTQRDGNLDRARPPGQGRLAEGRPDPRPSPRDDASDAMTDVRDPKYP